MERTCGSRRRLRPGLLSAGTRTASLRADTAQRVRELRAAQLRGRLGHRPATLLPGRPRAARLNDGRRLLGVRCGRQQRRADPRAGEVMVGENMLEDAGRRGGFSAKGHPFRWCSGGDGCGCGRPALLLPVGRRCKFHGGSNPPSRSAGPTTDTLEPNAPSRPRAMKTGPYQTPHVRTPPGRSVFERRTVTTTSLPSLRSTSAQQRAATSLRRRAPWNRRATRAPSTRPRARRSSDPKPFVCNTLALAVVWWWRRRRHHCAASSAFTPPTTPSRPSAASSTDDCGVCVVW